MLIPSKLLKYNAIQGQIKTKQNNTVKPIWNTFPVTQAKYSSTSEVIYALYSVQGGVTVATNKTQPLHFTFTQLKLIYLKTNINFSWEYLYIGKRKG